VSHLLPDGIDHLAELPYTLFNAIRSAFNFMRFDELPKDEVPPRRIWLDGDRMSEWWKGVEARRKAKFGTSDKMADEEIEGDVSQNDTAGLLGMN
jgi:hypothetical protein